MTKPKAREMQLKLARSKRECFGHIPPPKAAVTPLAPLDHSHPPQSPKRSSIPVTPFLITPPQPKRRRFKKRTEKEKETLRSFKFEEKIVQLERKWLAVARYCWHWRHTSSSISLAIVRQIANDANVGQDTLRTWVRNALAGNSLTSKPSNIYCFLLLN